MAIIKSTATRYNGEVSATTHCDHVRIVAYIRKRGARTEFFKLCADIGAIVCGKNGNALPVQDDVLCHFKTRYVNNDSEREFSIRCQAYEIHIPATEQALAEFEHNVGSDRIVVDFHFVDTNVNVPYAFKKDVFGVKRSAPSKSSGPATQAPTLKVLVDTPTDTFVRIDYIGAHYDSKRPNKRGASNRQELDNYNEQMKHDDALAYAYVEKVRAIDKQEAELLAFGNDMSAM